ncbi:MAG: hypothetical protein IJD81_07305 [Oscillospiraceae bacterium]|nr:hypothetical protein [Oscillospiraceae bacterium]
MKRISPAERCVYIHIHPTEQRRFDLPMAFELLLDGQPVRKIYRLYGGIASQRIELTGLSHTVTLRTADGKVLQQVSIPAAPYNYLCAMEEDRGFAITTFGPMRPTPDCAEFEKLVRLLSGKLIRLFTPSSPICMLLKQLEERELDHLWFEFWETALIVHFMPKSGHLPDLRHDFDSTEPYKAVIGNGQLTLQQTLALEARIAKALRESPAAEATDFYYNEEGFFCARLK